MEGIARTLVAPVEVLRRRLLGYLLVPFLQQGLHRSNVVSVDTNCYYCKHARPD